MEAAALTAKDLERALLHLRNGSTIEIQQARISGDTIVAFRRMRPDLFEPVRLIRQDILSFQRVEHDPTRTGILIGSVAAVLWLGVVTSLDDTYTP